MCGEIGRVYVCMCVCLDASSVRKIGTHLVALPDHVRLDEEGALLLSLGVKGQGQQGPLYTIQWTDQTIRRKERRMNTCLLLLEDDGAELEHRGRHVGVVVVHGLGPVFD